MNFNSDSGGKDTPPDEPSLHRKGELEASFDPTHLLKERIQELETLNQELQALYYFSGRLRGVVEKKALIERALGLIIEMFQADSGTLFLLDKDNPQELIYNFGICTLTNLPLPGTRISARKGLTGQACQTGQSIRVADIIELLQQNASITSDPAPVWRSAMFVPLTDAEQSVIGVMNVLAARPHYFSLKQVQLAERLAREIAIALQQLEQLELHKEQGQLIAITALARTIAHEINQQLTILQANLDLVVEFNQTLDQETLEGMQQAITEITNRVRNYQKIDYFQIIEPVPGISILDYQRDQSQKL